MPPDPRDLDPVFASQVRLGAVAVLAARGSATFPELKDLLGVTAGNLSVHLTKLEEAGYVATAKDFDGKKPRTTVELTKAGRRAFLAHVDILARFARGSR